MKHQFLNSAIVAGIALMISGCTSIDLSNNSSNSDSTSVISKYSPSSLFKQSNAAPVSDINVLDTMNIQVEFTDKETKEKQTFTYLLPNNNRLQKTQQRALIGNQEIQFNLLANPCLNSCQNRPLYVSLEVTSFISPEKYMNNQVKAQSVSTSNIEAKSLEPIELAPININNSVNDPLTPKIPKVVQSQLPNLAGQANLNVMPGIEKSNAEDEEYILDPKTGEFVSESSPTGKLINKISRSPKREPLRGEQSKQLKESKKNESFQLNVESKNTSQYNKNSQIISTPLYINDKVSKNITVNNGLPHLFSTERNNQITATIRLFPVEK